MHLHRIMYGKRLPSARTSLFTRRRLSQSEPILYFKLVQCETHIHKAIYRQANNDDDDVVRSAIADHKTHFLQLNFESVTHKPNFEYNSQ